MPETASPRTPVLDRLQRNAPAAGSGTGDGEGLTAFRAAVLGAVQGPTELLPVSSSAHLRIVLGLDRLHYQPLDDPLRNRDDLGPLVDDRADKGRPGMAEIGRGNRCHSFRQMSGTGEAAQILEALARRMFDGDIQHAHRKPACHSRFAACQTYLLFE